MPTFIDIHVIQSLPPSNVNRDDTGSPKSAIYGGVKRARVSSQAWKRAARAQFSTHVDTSELGYRTKRLVELLAPKIVKLAGVSEEEAQERAAGVITALGLKLEKPRARKAAEPDAPEQARRAEYLVFLSAHQLDRLAQLASSSELGKVDKKAAKDVVKGDHGVDVSLFGRMVADAADLNVDAAVQVAHALSTHAVDNEDDYYTAVDDQNPAEDTGAGMIGTVEFNSATLYRFATINVDGLFKNLENADATGRAAAAFTQGFVTSMPTGKQNSFGNRTLPDAVVVMVRDSQPVSLVGAFEQAVPVDPAQGYVRESCARLAAYAEAVGSQFGVEARDVWVTRGPQTASAVDRLGAALPLAELVAKVRQAATDAAAR